MRSEIPFFEYIGEWPDDVEDEYFDGNEPEHCKACDAELVDLEDDGYLRKCKCGHVNPIDIEGIGSLTTEQLGKTCNKYSWCGICEALTLNVPGTYADGQAMWKDGRPESHVIKPENFKCDTCGNQKFWQNEYNCPTCDSDRHAVIEIGPSHYNYYKALEFSGDPQDWDELWWCRVCGEKYSIESSNY